MKRIVPLSDSKIRTIKTNGKRKTFFDGLGLYLLVVPSGGKYWRFKYSFDSKDGLLALGTYPEVPLAEARFQREAARKLLSSGIDPAIHRQAQKKARKERAANSFEVVGREWFVKFASDKAASHSSKVIRCLERDIFPWVGENPVSEIQPPDLLSVLRKIENRGAVETAHRALGVCSMIFRYAVSTGRALSDPCRDLRGALAPVKSSHFSAITDPKEMGGLLRAFDEYRGNFVVRCALKLAPLLFVRPGELRQAEWKDFDFDSKEWRFLVTKTKTPHIVPLSNQAIEILRELHLLTGNGQYVFPGGRTSSRSMSNNAILAALRRMGFSKEEMTGHGFRAMARTVLDEVLGFRPEYIEQQLAHTVRDPMGRAYNRTAHLEERRKMMQKWADYLDQLKA